jgi:hypothetical protein
MRWTLLGMIVGVIAVLRLSGAVTTGGLILGEKELELRRKAGRPISAIHFGGVVIKNDVSPELAAKVIWKLRVFGGVIAPKAVMDNLPGRVTVTGGMSLE